MTEIDPSTILPNLLFGLVLIVAGILVIKFRDRIFRATVGFERATFGKAGQALANRQSPVGSVIAGCFGIAMGCFAIGLAVTAIIQVLS